MSGDVSSVAESRSHLFNRERVFVGDGRYTTVSPAATAATSVATSIRVPVMHGLPNRMSGSIEMPGNISIVFVYCF